MKISLTNAGKRFNREWIFKGATLEFSSGNAYAVTGPNGSGKSTLLQAIGGMLQLSEGGIAYSISNQQSAISNHSSAVQDPAGKQLAGEEAFREISFCAPYMDVVEEMTLTEFLRFHNAFKPLLPQLTSKQIIEEIGLEGAAHKQIRYYSSGMKQRVKLAQAIFSNVSVVLLDEPCSNLDAKGIELYHSLISKYCKERLVIVCSNDEVEYRFCNHVVSILSFKPQARTLQRRV